MAPMAACTLESETPCRMEAEAQLTRGKWEVGRGGRRGDDHRVRCRFLVGRMRAFDALAGLHVDFCMSSHWSARIIDVDVAGVEVFDVISATRSRVADRAFLPFPRTASCEVLPFTFAQTEKPQVLVDASSSVSRTVE